jgi:predicted ATPase
MRIAVTGTHGSGKTTLIEDFLDGHRDYAHEQEPYWALAQQGVVFADGPTLADLEEQLGYSCAMILERAADERVIFDRSPLDFLAYLDVIGEGEGRPWEPDGRLLGRIERAMSALDLLVFLPLSSPDEFAADIEYPRLRRAVDRRLKTLLREDELGVFEQGQPSMLEIRGTRRRRLALVEEFIGRATAGKGR